MRKSGLTHEQLTRILALGLSSEQLSGVLTLLADILDKQETRLAKDRERQSRRRQREGVSQKEWQELRRATILKHGHQCVYCGTTEGPMHVDHVVAVAAGGKTELNNLVVACATCNTSKGDRDCGQWQEGRCQ